MTIASGTNQYQLGTTPVTGCGFSYSATELDSALSHVAKIVFDDSGKAKIESLLITLGDTDFEINEVKRILSNTKPLKDWHVGEALAQCYLTDQRNCYFPWPVSRDEKRSGSSLPGADLVGFQSNKSDYFFAFGEVKTSAQNKNPPGVIYGSTGLNQQLGNLKDDVKVRDEIVKYLGFRTQNSSWEDVFKYAAKNYIRCKTNVRIFGFLVRDVRPNQKDLNFPVNQLSKNKHTKMVIELLALYLPSESIGKLSSKVVSRY